MFQFFCSVPGGGVPDYGASWDAPDAGPGKMAEFLVPGKFSTPKSGGNCPNLIHIKPRFSLSLPGECCIFGRRHVSASTRINCLHEVWIATVVLTPPRIFKKRCPFWFKNDEEKLERESDKKVFLAWVVVLVLPWAGGGLPASAAEPSGPPVLNRSGARARHWSAL